MLARDNVWTRLKFKTQIYSLVTFSSLMFSNAAISENVVGNDSSGLQPINVVPKVRENYVDPNDPNCITPNNRNALNLGDAYGSGYMIYANINPGGCPHNYVMTNTVVKPGAYGYYNGGSRLVMRYWQEEVVIQCCPVRVRYVSGG